LKHIVQRAGLQHENCTEPSQDEVKLFSRYSKNIFSGTLMKVDRRSTVVDGSIPGSVIGIFHLHNPSDRTIDSALNRNEYQEKFLG
jgi:hypothetical protein